jgi:hypothetical protein
LGALFVADAQRVSIAKAVANGSSPSVLAKLLLGAADKYDFAGRCLTQVARESFDTVIPSLLDELGAMPAVLRACAANLFGQIYWGKGEYAKGLGFALDSVKRFEALKMGKGRWCMYVCARGVTCPA